MMCDKEQFSKKKIPCLFWFEADLCSYPGAAGRSFSSQYACSVCFWDVEEGEGNYLLWKSGRINYFQDLAILLGKERGEYIDLL